METVKHRFCDLPKGTRFKYPDGNEIWIAIESYRDGLVAAEVNPSDIIRGNTCLQQSLCCFVDDEWSLESEVDVIINY